MLKNLSVFFVNLYKKYITLSIISSVRIYKKKINFHLYLSIYKKNFYLSFVLL